MAIDPVLLSRLREKGMIPKIEELEEAEKGTGTGAVAKEAAKQFFKPWSEAQKKVIAPVARVIAPLGESVGAAIAARPGGEVQKLQKEAQSQQSELADKVIAQLKDPNISRENKQRLFQHFSQTNPDIIGQVPELQKTAKQVFGEAVVTGVSALALTPGLAAGGRLGKVTEKILSANQKIQTLGKGTEIGSTGIKLEPSLGPKLAGFFLRQGKLFGEGAAMGSAIALQEGKTDAKEIGKDAATLGAVSVFVPPVLGRAIKFGADNIRFFAKQVDEQARIAAEMLRDISQKSQGGTGNFLIDTATRRPATIKQTLAQMGAKTLDVLNKPIEPQLSDRLFALRQFDVLKERIAGNPIVNTPLSAYRKARLSAGVPQGKFTVAKSDYDEFTKEYEDIMPEVNGYLKGLDLANRASRGQAVEAGKTLEDITKELTQIEERVIAKDGNLNRLQQATQRYTDFNKRFINEYLDSGLKSQEQIDAMLEANPNWVPHDVLDFYEQEAVNAFRGNPGVFGSFNVFDDVVKKAVGSEREIAPVEIATLHRLEQVLKVAERNRVMNTAIDDAVRANPEAFGMRPLQTAEQVEIRAALFNEVKDLLGKQKQDAKAGKILNEFEDRAKTKVKKLVTKQDTASIKDLKQRIEKTTNQMDELFEEARVLSTEFSPERDINNVLGKVQTREKRLFNLQDQLNKQIEDYNFTSYVDVKKQQEAIAAIRQTRRQLDEIVEMRQQDIKELRELIDSLRPEKAKPVDYQKEGLEKVSFFRRGIREEWLVPADLGAALKNLDAYQAGTIMKWLSIPARTLRAGATRLSPAFTLSNVPRDIQTAGIISKEGLSRKAILEAMNEVTNLNNPQTREFFEQGGAFGGLIGAEKPARDVLSESQRSKALDIPVKIGRAIESVGERFENATRFAVYKKAIEGGMTPAQAAFEARNATVDFAKMGNLVGMMNQLIPFLNARTQGLINVGSKAINDPEVFVRRQLFQSIYPSMYLFAYNSQFPSYFNIDQRDRNQNWIIMLGEEDGFDASGAPIKIPIRLMIKKGEAQGIPANLVDAYLSRSYEENPQEVGDFLRQNVLDATPINISSFGPLATPFELQANYDLFRKRAIEPEFQEIVPGGKKLDRDVVPSEFRANRFTGQTAKDLSEMGLSEIGLSPARIEFIVGKIFGTAGSDLLKLLDIAQTGIDQTGIKEGEAAAAQVMSRIPVIRTFIGSSAGAEKIMQYEILERLNKEKALNIDIPREMEAYSLYQMADVIFKKEGRDAANQFMRAQELDKDMIARIKRIKENSQNGQTLQAQIYDKITGNDLRAKYLIENLNMIDSRAQKNQLIKDVGVSKEVRKLLKQAKEKGLLKEPLTD